MSEPHDNAPVAQTDASGLTAAGNTGPGTGVAATNAEVRHVEAAGETGPIYTQPEFWVAIGFLLFVGLLLYLKVHTSAAAALDARGAKIKADLDEAARLRADAEALLAAAQARLAGSADEAAKIVAQATRNAAEIAEAGVRDLDALIVRRTAAADARIAAAERASEAGLRAQAVDMATARARDLLAANDDAAVQARLVDAAIADLGRGR